ncbi:MAG: hypothetical protein ACI4ED_06580, partial [Suilimivivens sp.]
MEEVKLYGSFLKELIEWTKSGALPESGNQDTAFYLELQQNRLKERNIRMEYRFSDRKGVKKNSEFRLIPTIKDPKYTIKMVADDFSREVRCYKENKCLFKEKKDTLFYQVITYLNDSSVSGEELYCCPNCSAASTIKSLLTGCPYCGTRFQMTDLFPKITNFYYSDFGINYNMIRMSKLIGAGFAAFATLLGILRAQSFGAMVETLLSGLFAVPLFSFLGYFSFSLFLMIYSVVRGIAVAPQYVGRDRARRKITSFMKRYDPAFSYDYFLSKVVSLLKIILFTNDRSNLAVCQGKVEKDAFRDIVDVFYQGTVTLNSCQVEGKYCYLDIDLYMSGIHDGGNRVYKKKDIFRMKLCKDITKPEDYGFSIRKVQCRGCGGSFDASRIRYCPFCGREYDLKEDDWVVLDIK